MFAHTWDFAEKHLDLRQCSQILLGQDTSKRVLWVCVNHLITD